MVRLILVRVDKLRQFKIKSNYVPEINLKITSIEVRAKVRKLRVIWD